MFLLLIKGMRKGGESKIFLSYRRVSGASPQFFLERGGVI